MLMAELPPDCIDLTVTSPPYDNLRDYHGYPFDFESIAFELFRVTKPGGVVVWVVADEIVNGSESGNSFRQALHFMELGFNLHQTMIYEKTGHPFPPSNRYYRQSEYMFVFSKGTPLATNLLRTKVKYKNKRNLPPPTRQADGSMERMKYKIGNDTRIKDNIWRYATGKGNTTSDSFAFEHPAMYPEALAKDHILSWSDPGAVVLDPMCGSGTTCKMAKQNGRQFLGFDISDEYCEIASKRIKGAQTPLFLLEQCHITPRRADLLRSGEAGGEDQLSMWAGDGDE